MEKVKGCPFCGSRCALIEEWSDYTMEPGVMHPMRSRLIFGCPSCECTITIEAEGEKPAVRIWQTREGGADE